MEWLKGKKTFIVAVLMVVVGVLNVVTGSMSFSDFMHSQDLMVVLTGMGFGAIRSAIEGTK